MNQQTTETGATMIAKAAPPVTVTTAMLAGVPVDDLIKWCTLAYVTLMLLHYVWKVSWGAYRFWVLKKRDGNDDA
jgi:hypothetical protein